MTRFAILLSLAAALAAATPAVAAAATNGSYQGRTSTGHPITFKIKNDRVHNLTAGVAVSCLSIQGGGAPTGGTDVFGFRGSRKLKSHDRWSFMTKPAFHYNETTVNYESWLRSKGSRTITGRLRIQYSFLIPKYPIGTFTIYSCLGGATFKAARR